jgi:hypothetical protein
MLPLVARDRWQALSADQRNGARLGCLLIPAERAVDIWEPMAEIPDPRSASKRPAASTEIPSSPGWRSILRRSGRVKAGLPSPDQGVGPRRAGPGNLSAKSTSMNPI